MTNTIAICLGLLLFAALAVDYSQYDWEKSIFLMRKFADLIEWMAFWR
jgi:hypothetical protein